MNSPWVVSRRRALVRLMIPRGYPKSLRIACGGHRSKASVGALRIKQGLGCDSAGVNGLNLAKNDSVRADLNGLTYAAIKADQPAFEDWCPCREVKPKPQRKFIAARHRACELIGERTIIQRQHVDGKNAAAADRCVRAILPIDAAE